MQNLMQQLVKAENACCIYAYHIMHSDISARDLEHHLGITRRSIRRWRQAIRQKKCRCTDSEHCAFKKGIIISAEYRAPERNPL